MLKVCTIPLERTTAGGMDVGRVYAVEGGENHGRLATRFRVNGVLFVLVIGEQDANPTSQTTICVRPLSSIDHILHDKEAPHA